MLGVTCGKDDAGDKADFAENAFDTNAGERAAAANRRLNITSENMSNDEFERTRPGQTHSLPASCASSATLSTHTLFALRSGIEERFRSVNLGPLSNIRLPCQDAFRSNYLPVFSIPSPSPRGFQHPPGRHHRRLLSRTDAKALPPAKLLRSARPHECYGTLEGPQADKRTRHLPPWFLQLYR